MAGFFLGINSGFFDPNGGGSSIWFQHARWFLGYPELWFQIVQSIAFIVGTLWFVTWLWRQDRKALSGLILFLFFLVWIGTFYAARAVHFAFTQGLAAGEQTDWSFYYLRGFGLLIGVATLIVLIVTDFRVFRSKGRLFRNTVSNLFLLTAVLLLLLSAVIASLAMRGTNDLLHDTYYLVWHQEHFWGVIVFCFLSAVFYRYFHAILKVHYRNVLALGHWALFTAGTFTYFLKVSDPLEGMPRRYVDYAPLNVEPTTDWLLLAAAFVTLCSFAVFAICVVEALYRRVKYGKEPDRRNDRPDLHF